MASLSAESLKSFESNKSLTIGEYNFIEEDILIFREPLDQSNAASNADITVVLDTTLDEQLLAEGVAREMINRIQKIRKAMDFQVDDRINICLDCNDQLAAVIKPHVAMIQKETLCNHWAFQAIAHDDTTHAITIDDYHARIEIVTTC